MPPNFLLPESILKGDGGGPMIDLGQTRGELLVDKQRIEEEELKLAAEERYRAEVRAKLRSPAQRSTLLFLILGAVVLIVLVVSAIVWSRTGAPATKSSTNSGDTDAAQQAAKPSPLTPPVPKTRYVPVDQKIVTGQITLKARRSLQYRVTITPEMLEPILTGSFTASGGHSNDIMAVIADETNYTNWINGHEARSFWSTQGRETTGRFEVHLSPGTYYLGISNKFSRFTDKQVLIPADLNYKMAETYYDNPNGQPSSCPVPPCTGVNPYPAKVPAAPER